MKIIIKIDDTNLTSIQFKDKNEILDWGNLTKEKQEQILNSLWNHYILFYKFLKDE